MKKNRIFCPTPYMYEVRGYVLGGPIFQKLLWPTPPHNQTRGRSMYEAALWPLAVARLHLWSALWPPFHQFGSRNRARALRRFCVRCRRCASADANCVGPQRPWG